MALPLIQNQQTNLETLEDIIFDTPVTLPAADWELSVSSGNAWVFSDSGDFVLNPNETAYLYAEEGEITIRRLYVRGSVKFTARRFV